MNQAVPDQTTNEPNDDKPSKLMVISILVIAMLGFKVCLFVLLPTINEYLDIVNNLHDSESFSLDKWVELQQQKERWLVHFLIWYGLIGGIVVFLAIRYWIVMRMLAGLGSFSLLSLGFIFWAAVSMGWLYTDRDPILHITAIMLTFLCWRLTLPSLHLVYRGEIKNTSEIFNGLSNKTQRILSGACFLMLIAIFSSTFKFMLSLPEAMLYVKIVLAVTLGLCGLIALQFATYMSLGHWLKRNPRVDSQ